LLTPKFGAPSKYRNGAAALAIAEISPRWLGVASTTVRAGAADAGLGATLDAGAGAGVGAGVEGGGGALGLDCLAMRSTFL
jgi:hypothetical protein